MSKHIEYTKEQDEWLINNFNKNDTTKELVNKFNITFNTNYKYDTIKKHCIKKLNLVRNINSTKENLNIYTNEEIEWFENNYKNYLVGQCFDMDLFISDFEKIFNKKLNKSKAYNFIYGKTNVKFGRNKKLIKPKAQLPIGTERKIKGVWYVKVDNKKDKYGYSRKNSNWKQKSRYLYEKYYNCELATNDHILHLDGNYENFDKENLIRLDEKEFMMYIGNKFSKLDNIDLKKCAILYSKIEAKIK